MDRELVSKRKICSGTIYVTKPDKFRLGVNNSGARQELFFKNLFRNLHLQRLPTDRHKDFCDY